MVADDIFSHVLGAKLICWPETDKRRPSKHSLKFAPSHLQRCLKVRL